MKLNEIKIDRKGIVLADIDDTMLKADPSKISVWKTDPGGIKTKLTTNQFANDPDLKKPGYDFNFDEFRDPKKVRSSVLSGTPLFKNLRIIEDYIDNGYDFAFLTARGAEDITANVLDEFLEKHSPEIRSAFKRGFSRAVSDESYMEILDGYKHFEAKAYFLKQIADMYADVIFIDDDPKNLKAIEDLHLDNVTVIKAR